MECATTDEATRWTVASADGRRCVCRAGAALDYSGVACAPCAANTYSYASNAETTQECHACPAGTLTTTIGGATACDACAPGHFFFANSSSTAGLLLLFELLFSCQQCPPGTFATGIDASVCDGCAPGTFADDEARVSACGRCAPGTFAAGGSSSACDDCAAGTFAADAGATNCTDCAAGTIAEAGGRSGCAACAPDTFAPPLFTSSSTGCLDCAPGFSTRGRAGAQGCECALGRAYDPATRTCRVCPPGTFSPPLHPFPDCQACPPGTFGAAEGATACDACAYGDDERLMMMLGATACADDCTASASVEQRARWAAAGVCQCPVGHYNGGDGCRPCRDACGAFDYMVAPCLTAHDLQCAECTAECPAGRFRLTNCTPTTDTVCWPCSAVCPLQGHYVVAPCTPLRNTRCAPCTRRCPPGHRLTAPCSAEADRACDACPPGTYLPDGDDEACAACPPGTVTTEPGAAIACTPCAGYADPLGTACLNACPPGTMMMMLCVYLPLGYHHPPPPLPPHPQLLIMRRMMLLLIIILIIIIMGRRLPRDAPHLRTLSARHRQPRRAAVRDVRHQWRLPPPPRRGRC
jgi:hypothetical protein